MGAKKKPDTRLPQLLTQPSFDEIKTMMQRMSTLTEPLLSIGADEVKYFKRLSADDRNYIKDVVDMMTMNQGKVATNENVDNIKQAMLAGEQFREVAKYLRNWLSIFERNAVQAESYSYQHAAVYEDDIDNAISADVKGAIEMKERLESNREARNAATAATKRANAKQEAEVVNN